MSKSITCARKLRVCMSVVSSTMTYTCRTWMKTGSITSKFDSVVRVSWRDHTYNEEVIRRVGVSPLSGIVSDKRRRMTAHVLQLLRERPAREEEWEAKEDVETDSEGGSKRDVSQA